MNSEIDPALFDPNSSISLQKKQDIEDYIKKMLEENSNNLYEMFDMLFKKYYKTKMPEDLRKYFELQNQKNEH